MTGRHVYRCGDCYGYCLACQLGLEHRLRHLCPVHVGEWVEGTAPDDHPDIGAHRDALSYLVALPKTDR